MENHAINLPPEQRGNFTNDEVAKIGSELGRVTGERDRLRTANAELVEMLRLYLVPYPQTLERNELNRMARGLLWKNESFAKARP